MGAHHLPACWIRRPHRPQQPSCTQAPPHLSPGRPCVCVVRFRASHKLLCPTFINSRLSVAVISWKACPISTCGISSTWRHPWGRPLGQQHQACLLRAWAFGPRTLFRCTGSLSTRTVVSQCGSGLHSRCAWLCCIGPSGRRSRHGRRLGCVAGAPYRPSMWVSTDGSGPRWGQAPPMPPCPPPTHIRPMSLRLRHSRDLHSSTRHRRTSHLLPRNL